MRVKLSTSIFLNARTSLTSWWEYYQGSDRNALRSWQTLKQCFCKFTSLNVIDTCCASCGGRTGNLDQQPLTYRMTVHLFGAGLSPGCCNFALKTAEDYEKELPYLFDYKPSDFCTKLNWKLVKSLQDRGFGLQPNIFAKKKFSNAARASFECLYSAISRAIINNTNYR